MGINMYKETRMSSEEYDNTNKGAVFPPFSDNDKLVLSGKIDIEGAEHKVAVIKTTTKNGTNLLKVYTEFCALFENDSSNDNAPQYSGNIEERFFFDEKKPLRLAAWKKQNQSGKGMLSLQVSEKQSKPDSGDKVVADLEEDIVPF